MLIWVLFCIVRCFHIKENLVVLFPGGARPHPVTVALATQLVKIDRIDRFHFSVYERAQRAHSFPTLLY